MSPPEAKARRDRAVARRIGRGALAILLTACAVDNVGVDPPDGKLFFPSGLALSPRDPADPESRSWLYVTNGNADLKYNKGTLLAVDLDEYERRAREYEEGGGSGFDDKTGCVHNRIGPAITSCDEARSSKRDLKLVPSCLRVPSFAGEIEARFDDDGGRLYFPTRGESTGVSWVDVSMADGRFLAASEGKCEEPPDDPDSTIVGAVTEMPGALGEADPIPDEPFGMTFVEGCAPPRLLVTHLSRGVVSLLEEGQTGRGRLEGRTVSGVLFPFDWAGRRRAYSIAPRTNECGSPLYVTSSTWSRVATVLVDGDSEQTRLISGPGFSLSPPLDDQVDRSGREQDATDTRGLAFSADGDRLWVVSREPPSLVAVDTSIEDGLPRNRPEAVVEVCPEPSVVKVRDQGTTTLVYVVCFATSEIYVVDGDLMAVIDVIETGRGPASLEFDEVGGRAFVAHFAENTIGEVVLDPASPHYHRMVRTIGLPEPLTR